MIKNTKKLKAGFMLLYLLAAFSIFAQTVDYTVFAEETIIFADRSTLKGSSLRANGNLELGYDTIITGNIFTAGDILLKDRAAVIGNVNLNGTLLRNNQTRISGTIDDDAGLSIYNIPEKSFSVGTNDITLYSQQSLNLPPGDYRNIEVYYQGTLALEAGVYNLSRLKIYPDTRLLLDSSGGKIYINVINELYLADRVTVVPSTGTDPNHVMLYTHQTETIYVGCDTHLAFTLSAPRAEINIGSRTTFAGKIAARKLILNPDVTIIEGDLKDSDNDWMPDCIETALGRDPDQCESPVSFAEPDDWLNDPGSDQLVLYKLPFGVWLSPEHQGDYTYLEIPAGAMATTYNPVITFVDPGSPGVPAINLAPGEKLLGTYHIYGELNPGYTLKMPFPVHRDAGRLIGARNITLAYRDTATATWVEIPITSTSANTFFAMLAELNTIYYITITNTIILVNEDAAAGGSGRGSWQNAVPTIQDALALVSSVNDEIWVAEGTYYPDYSGNREASLSLPSNVPLFGGFAGFEHSLSQRDYENNPTILSGDIGTAGLETDNSFRIIAASNDSYIDGFEIRNAYDHRETPPQMNGTITLRQISDVEIRNCRIEDNYGYHSGGAIVVDRSSGILISGCYFENNVSTITGSGGAIALIDCSGQVTLEHCIFNNNTGVIGGAIEARGCNDLRISGSLFYDNTGVLGGGILFEDDNTAVIDNCTFTKNTALMYGGGIRCFGANNQLTLSNSIFWNNSSSSPYSEISTNMPDLISINHCNIDGSGGSGSTVWPYFYIGIDDGGNIDTDPLFTYNTNPLGPDGIPATWDDGLRLSGNNSPCAGAGTGTPLVDLLGQLKSSGAPDMGAYNITPTEHTGYAADFIDHRGNNYGFDKVPLNSPLADPTEIYINLPLGGTTYVNVIAPNPTGLYLRSSNTSVFTIEGATANALPLPANVTGVQLNARTSASAHLSALLEVCDASANVLRALHVETYRELVLSTIGSYRIIDSTSPGTGGDVVRYSEQRLLTEMNKAVHQAVIHIQTATVENEKDIPFDLNGNGRIDHYAGITTTDPEINIVTEAINTTTNNDSVKFGLFNACSLAWSIIAPAGVDSSVIYVGNSGWMTGSSQYTIHTSSGSEFTIFTESVTPVTDGTGFQVKLSQPLPEAIQAGDYAYSIIMGLAADPQIITVSEGIFTTIAHEMLHRQNVGGLSDLGAPDNIMFYVSGDNNKKLRFRTQTRYYYPAYEDEQWNLIPR